MTKLSQLVSKLPQDVDAVLITSPHNRFYYTGMSSTAGTLLATREGSYFIIDFRYIEAARAKVSSCEVILQDKLGDQLRDLVAKHHVKRVGLESGSCSLKSYLSFKEMLPECELLVDNRITDLIDRQRMIKDEEELSRIRRAQALTDKGFEYICERIRPGMTEREIALDLEFYTRREGSEEASFDFIVVSGKKTSLPHGVPGDNVIQKGDFVTMDFGCVIEGYHSDMTRTVAVGEPSEEMRRVYDTVLEANLRALAAVKAGVPCIEVDKVARDLIYGAGYEGCFGHGLGHSVGIQIHEDPRFSPVGVGNCEPGMIMTIEPGIYLEGRFGCRIEDMIYITQDGCINLTASPKELLIL